MRGPDMSRISKVIRDIIRDSFMLKIRDIRDTATRELKVPDASSFFIVAEI